ncbi:MAG: triacylglycerol lipase [Clostridiaceae bacterium]
MKTLYRVISSVLLFIAINSFSILFFTTSWWIIIPFAIVYFLIVNIFPNFKKQPTFRIKMLSDGAELLKLFLITTSLSVLYTIFVGIKTIPAEVHIFIISLVIVILAESLLFWNGIVRVYGTSIQLGIKRRIIGIACGWIPIVHIYALVKIINIATAEAEFEIEKFELNSTRKEKDICKTRYPLLMVHGVFFRDTRYFNYWGRISGELIKNGAVIFYGQQQSAASVKRSGEELSDRIKNIIKDTGCEKVNIIAHSKGGLDSRYAISCLGMDQYVASLTTINTPHKGCIFADYLLEKVPEKVRNSIANRYNTALRKLGDTNPDFIAAITDLTASQCKIMNETVTDIAGIYYQSAGSKMNRARSGKFPLNIAYPFVRHFDGDNDGLVSVKSAQWGENFIMISINGKRGVSHGDVIDLNRENIRSFDVREFYVSLVEDLKKRGL